MQLNVSQRPRSTKRLAAVRAALITRKTLRNTLILDECPPARPEAGQVIAQLQGATASITEVVIRTLSQPELSTVPPFPLPCTTLSHITSLQLSPCSYKLPPPKELPQLRSLSAALVFCRTEAPKRALYNSITAYLPQLVSLQLDRPASAWDVVQWPRAFTPATTTHTLTKLSTDARLCDELLQLLLKHAPRLQELAVQGLALRQSHEGVKWGLRRLSLGRRAASEDSLVGLPHTEAGRVEVQALSMDIDLVR